MILMKKSDQVRAPDGTGLKYLGVSLLSSEYRISSWGHDIGVYAVIATRRFPGSFMFYYHYYFL